jgi:serine/threonine protein kinase
MNTCPKCSTEFSSDTPGGLCPACLLRQGMEAQTTAAAEPSDATAQSISPEQLAALLPQFDQVELIGRGGMGVVYKARQKNLDRFVAIKVLSSRVANAAGFAERFAREARAMARLNHPNIVAVHDFGSVTYDGHQAWYFTMEYVNGSNLRAVLTQVSSEQALAIVPQICEALQYAHDIGIVHRDIKPENILIDKTGRVKIADFGVAKLQQQARSQADYTLTGTDWVMGTPGYMAPEQMERPTEVDHRADLYSLGVVFYEMLTGQLPKGRFALPSQKVHIDVRLDEVVLKALEHDRELRYQHASEVRTSIESVRDTAVKQTKDPVPIAPAIPVPLVNQPPPRLSRMTVIAAICGVVGMLSAPLILFATLSIQNLNNPRASLHEWEPHWAVALFFAASMITGLAAAAMTLLGVIAVPRIRRSPEKLYGLRLALLDAMLCPLLLLDAIILESLASLAELHQHDVFTPWVFILALVLTLPCDAVIYWLVWRKLRITKTPSLRTLDFGKSPAKKTLFRSSDWWLLALYLLAVLVACLLVQAVPMLGALMLLAILLSAGLQLSSRWRKQVDRERGLGAASGDVATSSSSTEEKKPAAPK